MCEGVPDRRQALGAEGFQGGEPPIVRRDLELLQRFDAELVLKA
jgi:hypothetical protein